VDQVLPAPEYFHASSFHVDVAGSPAFGMGWNAQRCLPVRTSNARTSPGGPFIYTDESCSSIDAPTSTVARHPARRPA
jgi:hypothetical protein